VGPADLHHRLIGLDGGQVEEVAAHLLDLGQVVSGVGIEAGLEVGRFGGVDETIALSRSWLLLGLIALRYCLLLS
jgi:hypothetical protein